MSAMNEYNASRVAIAAAEAAGDIVAALVVAGKIPEGQKTMDTYLAAFSAIQDSLLAQLTKGAQTEGWSAGIGGGGGGKGRGKSKEQVDEDWNRYFANPAGYYDNRGDSRASSGGGRGPDFKSKTDDKDALWLNGQYGPAPAWVFQKLGMPAPDAPPAQVSPGLPAPQPVQNPFVPPDVTPF